ncbi:Peptidase C48, SUMO/Sentrin/Ubl1 [Artemisia annua]|uniref:Peptidase C48, SUMO/Sentrin/Ubl1 n=1 Tax=Artemisia annua TaxID=35608 RepID=A0A2U1L989_ARTAN|nr:Peptidase C48, SUMO/Sentrin/Ubl1 [Artemisia annua]
MEMLNARRSGRLSNRRRRNHDNDEEEVIDLTTLEWDHAREEFVNGGQDTTGEEINVDIAPDKAAETNDTLEDGVGIEVDNSKKNGGNDKLDSNKMEDAKAKCKLLKGRLAALVEKVKKNQADKGKSAVVKRKKAEKIGKGKMKNVDVEDENVRDKHTESVDGESTDDDFVSSKKLKTNTVAVKNKKKPRSATNTKGKCNAETENGIEKEMAGMDKVDQVKRVQARNPPKKLYQVITELSSRQKESVREIGFSELLEFKINNVPTRLSYWLLDNFDEEACCLIVNGRRIEITRDLVRNVLGVPFGDVHVDARDEADFRNALTRAWKAQFGSNVKRHYTRRLAELILSTRQGGWLFKINFLVLLFSTIGEANKCNTVNLKFLPCIKSEADILQMDWCTYIIECLIKTKIQWNRNSHFNGPLVLLLVVYANSYTPIKFLTSEVFNKLEKEMFPNDGDDEPVVAEESEDESLEEENDWEDDEFGEYERDRVPTDVQGKKRYVSFLLKKAAELVELADEVLDDGLAEYPDDADFIDLKELRDDMFIVRTFTQKLNDINEPDDETYDNCHTPCNGGKQQEDDIAVGEEFPFTQMAAELSDRVCAEFHRNNDPIPTRLDFDDDGEFDLNITQRPATQGKVVGCSNDDKVVEDGQRTEDIDGMLDGIIHKYVSQEPPAVPEFKTPDKPKQEIPNACNTPHGLSRFGRESLKNQNKAIIPTFSQPQPLNVLMGKQFQFGRGKRPSINPEILRSPYVIREVSLVARIMPHEERAADCLFSARLTETDIVFRTKHDVDGQRCVLETLYPGIEVASGAIDMFTHVLNEAERARNKYTMTRLFCHTAMLTSEMEEWEYINASDKFNENMDMVLSRSQYSTLDGVQLVFFPIINVEARHFYLICMNLKNNEVEYLDNIDSTENDVINRYGSVPLLLVSLFEDYLLHKNNPNYYQMVAGPNTILPMGCRTTNNFIDCGVFVMRHMETYKGEGSDGDLCCLSKEGKEQLKELRNLRYKYVAKILLADCNIAKKQFEMEAEAFRKLPMEERKRLKRNAFSAIKPRVIEMMK